MSVKWTNLPKGLKLVITTANGAAYPKIIGTPEALERWKPKFLEIQAGNPSTVAVEDTGVTFSSLMSIPNQVQMLTLFGTESGTIDMELSEILADAGAVRWALESGWTTPEEASALLEAFEPPQEPVAEPPQEPVAAPPQEPVAAPPQEPVAAPEMDQPIEPLPESNPNPSVEPPAEKPPEQSLPEAQPQPIQNDSLVPAEALTANDKRYSWVDLSAYGLRLVMSETNESYQAQGGAASIPTIEGSRSTIQAFKLRLDALGMAIVENEERIAAFYLDVDEIPALDVIQIQFPMAKLTEVSMADIERPLDGDLAQTPPIIDFDTVDFTPVQDALAKGLISRAKMKLSGQTPSPITQSEMIDLASRYTGIAPEMFNRELTNYSFRQTQEILETSGVIAARDLTASALVNNEFSPELAEMRIEALVSDLPNMDVRSGDSQELMQYSTPLHMGLLAQKTLGIQPGDQRSVWEPTMGNGALLTMINPENISGIELDPKRVQRLNAQGVNAIQGNAIDTTAVKARSKDVVVMNPPFGQLPDEHRKGTKGLTYYNILAR